MAEEWDGSFGILSNSYGQEDSPTVYGKTIRQVTMVIVASWGQSYLEWKQWELFEDIQTYLQVRKASAEVGELGEEKARMEQKPTWEFYQMGQAWLATSISSILLSPAIVHASNMISESILNLKSHHLACHLLRRTTLLCISASLWSLKTLALLILSEWREGERAMIPMKEMNQTFVTQPRETRGRKRKDEWEEAPITFSF